MRGKTGVKNLTLGLIGSATLLLAIGPIAMPSAADQESAAPLQSSDESRWSDAEVARLRSLGPTALESLFAERDRLIARQAELQAVSGIASDDPRIVAVQADIAQINAAIDRVGGQRYCSASRLFWYTDMEAARKAAAESGKPILCLRMLGNLTDELSCANSRFFRTTLYSNAEISAYLRDHFILEWESVRPVPVVTIDFGDGRKLVRTITGNSAHYIVAADGRVIDVLPGLYSPAAFTKELRDAEAAARAYASTDSESRETLVRTYHEMSLQAIDAAFNADLARLNETAQPAAPQPQIAQAGAAPAAPNAAVATERARPKALVELPTLQAIELARNNVTTRIAGVDEGMWDRLAALHVTEVQLDPTSVALITSENPTALQAGRLAITKRVVETPMMRMLRNLRTSIAVDTVRNEYDLHRRIHLWFVAGEPTADIGELNRRVYSELFLTPDTDPWLGLATEGTYTALDNGGLRSE